MDYARHHAELSSRTGDGTDMRAYLEASAQRGNADALRRLEGPDFPDSLEYLWLWALELHGRSGVGMAGLAPLTYTTVRDWSLLTGNRPDPIEVSALMQLDSALRVPDSKPDASDPKPTPKWPEKKHG